MILYWILGLCLLRGSLGEENVLQVNTKRVLSVVNEEFIGFSINSRCLTYHRCVEGLRNLSSEAQNGMFVKIHGIDVAPNYEILSALKELTKSSKIQPIVILDYHAKDWNPRQHLGLLQKINDLEVKKCTFQLGTEFNEEDMFTYTDDLATFRFMIDAFSKFNNTWRITGADLADTMSLVDARIYTKLARNYVGSFNWKKCLNSSSSDLSSTIQHLVDETFLPVSVTYQRPAHKSHDHKNCDKKCVSEGLRWAEELGEMAQKGFSNVFRSITKRDFLDHDFGNYISQVHHKLMGAIVLKIKSTGDESSGKFYAQCSKENPGQLVLMGVNSKDKSLKIKTKFPGEILGKTIKEVILRPEKNRIYLNDHILGEEIPIYSTPVILEKLVQDEELSVTLPPKSVGFWEISLANTSICTDTEHLTMKFKLRKPTESSMTNLLQELIQEISESHGINHKRKKRSIPRIFQHSKRDVSGKFKQILELFNKKIRGIQTGAFQPVNRPQQVFQPSGYSTQTYSAYQKPLIYTVSPQNAGQLFENPIHVNSEQLYGQTSIRGPTIVPTSVLTQQQFSQKSYQKPKVQQQPQPVISATLPVQETPFTGQILPGQTYQLSEAEAQAYLSGYGGQQTYQPEIADSYANAQPIYLNSYPDGQLEGAQASYQDLSALSQSPQAYVLQSPSMDQDNQMSYKMDSYPETWDSNNPYAEVLRDSSPNPSERIKSGFVTGKFLKDEPEIHLQLNKNDQVKYLGKQKDMKDDNFAEELSILTQLGYHEITHVDEEDKPQDEIHSRRRRTIFTDNRKRNILDLDAFPISLEGPEDLDSNSLRSSLDEVLNFLPRALKKAKSEENAHLQSIQSDSSEMKKQCKILSVAMENECLHDTLDDIRSLAKRAVKYISRKKFAQLFDWLLPPKLILKKRRFIRSPWSLEREDPPISMKDLEDALKTNKIIPIRPNLAAMDPPEIDPVQAIEKEAKITSQEHSESIEVQKSLNHFIHMMNSHIMSWWNLFA